MAFYIIKKDTNTLHPNLITGEAAIFSSQAEFDKDNSGKYRLPTYQELVTYKDNFIDFKVKQIGSEFVFVNHKDHTDQIHKITSIDYANGFILGEINLNKDNFIYQYELCTNQVAINDILQKEEEQKQQNITAEFEATKKGKATYLRNFADNIKIAIYICKKDSSGNIDTSKILHTFESSYQIIQDNLNFLGSGNTDPIGLPSSNRQFYYAISRGKFANIVNQIKSSKERMQTLTNGFIANIEHQCKNIEEVDQAYDSYFSQMSYDEDGLKDGYLSIFQNSENLEIYDFTKFVEKDPTKPNELKGFNQQNQVRSWAELKAANLEITNQILNV